MIGDLAVLTKCYIDNCNDEFKKRKVIRDIWLTNTNKLNEDYKNKLITRNQFISKLTKLDNKYFDSIENISFHQCEIDKCYNLIKNHLDYLSDRNNIKNKANYNIKDYIKIIKINNKNNLKTIPII
jgi:hypothetical protein